MEGLWLILSHMPISEHTVCSVGRRMMWYDRPGLVLCSQRSEGLSMLPEERGNRDWEDHGNICGTMLLFCKQNEESYS